MRPLLAHGMRQLINFTSWKQAMVKYVGAHLPRRVAYVRQVVIGTGTTSGTISELKRGFLSPSSYRPSFSNCGSERTNGVKT